MSEADLDKIYDRNRKAFQLIQEFIDCGPIYKEFDGENYCFFCKIHQEALSKETHYGSCCYARMLVLLES